MKKFLKVLVVCILALVTALPSFAKSVADSWPKKPVIITVPWQLEDLLTKQTELYLNMVKNI